MTANRQLGQLVPLPGVAGQFLWNQATNAWVQVTKAMVGLDQVSNTSDANKPISIAEQAALDLKAPIASPAFTGVSSFSSNVSIGGSLTTNANISIEKTSSAPVFGLNADAGQVKQLVFRSAGTDRWRFTSSSTAETGSNVGSDFTLTRCNDAGTGVDTPVSVARSTGEVSLAQTRVLGPLRVGQYTLTTLPSASAYSGYEIDVTNATGGSKRCRSSGTVWQILNTTTTVS